MYEFTIGGKSVSVFFSAKPDAPVIYLNTYSNEGQHVFQAAQAVSCPPFTLAAISNLNWNRDMAPWDSPAAFRGGKPFTGGADDHLRLLVEEILRGGAHRRWHCMAPEQVTRFYRKLSFANTGKISPIISENILFYFCR